MGAIVAVLLAVTVAVLAGAVWSWRHGRVAATAANDAPRCDGGTICMDASGFDVAERGRVSFRVRWDEVVGIAAHKVDQFTTDCICLAFRTRAEPDAYWTVNEEMMGFRELTEEIVARFPRARRDWYEAVVQPPMATQWTPIWGDAPGWCEQCGYNLIGNTSGRCPECGRPLAPRACPCEP